MKAICYDTIEGHGVEFEISQAAGELESITAATASSATGEVHLAATAILPLAAEAERAIQGDPSVTITLDEGFFAPIEVNTLNYRE
jgi:hypothetical protein